MTESVEIQVKPLFGRSRNIQVTDAEWLEKNRIRLEKSYGSRVELSESELPPEAVQKLRDLSK
jgi:hypothetical protein